MTTTPGRHVEFLRGKPPGLRPIPARFTAQQVAFITAVRDESNHLMLRATAGSGKTTTLTEAAWHLPTTGRATYFAFNKHSVDGIAPNLPRHVNASTLHAYGRRILTRARQDPQLQVDDKKSDRLAQSLAASLAHSGERPDFKLIRATARLWNAAREHTLDYTSHEDDLAALAVQVEWPGDFNPRVIRSALKSMKEASLTDFGAGGLPDFTDFLWLPLELKLEANSLAVALVDECQDLTPLRQRFVTHLLGLDRGEESKDAHGRLIAVGDKSQCQPSDTLVSVVRQKGGRGIEREVERFPISEVRAGDQVVTFTPRDGRFYLNGVVEQVMSRSYTGKLVTVTTPDGSKSRYTPNHHCYVNFSPLRVKYAVYVMRKGERFRIGMAKMDYGHSGSGPFHRARTEEADALWILSVHDSRGKAFLHEEVVSAKYGLPEMTFIPCTGNAAENANFTAEGLTWAWSQFEGVDLTSRAIQCLNDFGRNIQYPIYVPENQSGRSTQVSLKRPLVTHACNLLDGVLVKPFDEKLTERESSGEWVPASVRYEDYEGLVHSLKVSGSQLYVADGILTHNSIYAYAGADPLGMERLAESIGATNLPLSVSFRCPASHVQLAHRANTFIESAEGAKIGVIEHLSAEELSYQSGDVVLSRLNSPLIQTALKLLARGISVNIRGRDLATRLEAAAQDTFPEAFTSGTINDQVKLHYDKKAKPFTARAKEGDREAKKVLTDLKDICSCLRLLAERAVTLSPKPTATVHDLSALLRSLYRDDADVLFSTVHRAKGLEWDRVTLLYPETMPYPAGEYQEEMCVLFVALTRSKDTLRLAYGKEAWAGQKFLLPPQQGQERPESAWDEQRPLPFDPTLDFDEETFQQAEAQPASLDLSLRPLSDEEIQRPFTEITGQLLPPTKKPTQKRTQTEAAPAPVPPATPAQHLHVASPAQPATPRPAITAQQGRPPTPTPATPSRQVQKPAARIAPPRVTVQQTEEQRLGQLMLDALHNLESSVELPVPQKAVIDLAYAAGVQLRRQEQSTTLDDPRPTPLYHGSHAISVSELRLALDNLRNEPRPALREWAETSLVLLRTCTARFVNIHEPALRDAERAALQARISVPLLGPQPPKTVPVIVFDGSYGRVKAGKLTREAPKVLSVTVNGHVLRFDPRTGELLGTPFTPFATHIKMDDP